MNDDIGLHAVILAEGGNRSEVAAKLRATANLIEQGESPAQHWPTRALVRPWDSSGGEEPFVGRYVGVCSDGEESTAPWALFSDEEQASRFLQWIGQYRDEDWGWPNHDAGTTRCDVFLSVWNCIDDDPYATEQGT